MPYITVNTNTEITKEAELRLKTRFAAVLTEAFPTKTENWLMLKLEGEGHMYFGGADAPCAMVQVSLFGCGSDSGYDTMTEGVCRLLEGELGIPADRIYVKYEEVAHWGWNHSNF